MHLPAVRSLTEEVSGTSTGLQIDYCPAWCCLVTFGKPNYLVAVVDSGSLHAKW